MATRAISVLRRYGFAVLLVAAALGLTLLILGATQLRVPFLLFAAILIAGWYGGRGPAWLAAGLSILAVDYYFEIPVHSLRISAPEETFLFPFALCALLAAWSSSWKSRFESSAAKGGHPEEIPAQKPRV